jgi:dienelactone hydrolase
MTALTSHVTAVQVPVGQERLAADLSVPESPRGIVIFAHGSGSGRHSPRNQAVAQALQRRGLATLLADLLTMEEETVDRVTASLRFNIDLLGRRAVALVDWVHQDPILRPLRIGLFGASTGAAAALVAAAARPREVAAVVSRGGRSDLAGVALPQVTAPTLLLVGGLDTEVIDLNQWAKIRLHGPVSLSIVPGATHLFEEPGALEEVASQAGAWFVTHLDHASDTTEVGLGSPLRRSTARPRTNR